MAPSDFEPRPADTDYFAERTDYVRQGDLFTEVPLAYPWPPDAITHEAGSRRFLSGPFEAGFGMLITPTCSMAAQGAPGSYAHPVRTLAPVLPLERLLDAGAIKEGSLDDLRRYDHLINYFYVPAIDAVELPESLALLYGPVTIHHEYLEDRRVAQLSEVGAVHLKYKLAMLYGGVAFDRDEFSDAVG